MELRLKIVLGFLFVIFLTGLVWYSTISALVLSSEQLGEEARQCLAAGNMEERLGRVEGMVAEAEGRGQYALFAALIALALGGVLGLILASSILGPIRQLTEVIERISRGERGVEIPARLKESPDEIGALAMAFDRTMVSLKMAMGQTAPELKRLLEEKAATEAKLLRLNGLLAAMNEISAEGLRTREPRRLYELACSAAVQTGPYVFAWVGLVGEDGHGRACRLRRERGGISFRDKNLHRQKEARGQGPDRNRHTGNAAFHMQRHPQR
ncbi:MAG: HAMP domain-containing protein [Candidatus Micrarchaeota archaeon]